MLKRYSVLAFILLMTACSDNPSDKALAKQAPAALQSFSNEFIQFDYPAAWKVSSYDTMNMVSIAHRKTIAGELVEVFDFSIQLTQQEPTYEALKNNAMLSLATIGTLLSEDKMDGLGQLKGEGIILKGQQVGTGVTMTIITFMTTLKTKGYVGVTGHYADVYQQQPVFDNNEKEAFENFLASLKLPIYK